MKPGTIFAQLANPTPKANEGYTLAQNIVGRDRGVAALMLGFDTMPDAVVVWPH